MSFLREGCGIKKSEGGGNSFVLGTYRQRGSAHPWLTLSYILSLGPLPKVTFDLSHEAVWSAYCSWPYPIY